MAQVVETGVGPCLSRVVSTRAGLCHMSLPKWTIGRFLKGVGPLEWQGFECVSFFSVPRKMMVCLLVSPWKAAKRGTF